MASFAPFELSLSVPVVVIILLNVIPCHYLTSFRFGLSCISIIIITTILFPYCYCFLMNLSEYYNYKKMYLCLVTPFLIIAL